MAVLSLCHVDAVRVARLHTCVALACLLLLCPGEHPQARRDLVPCGLYTHYATMLYNHVIHPAVVHVMSSGSSEAARHASSSGLDARQAAVRVQRLLSRDLRTCGPEDVVKEEARILLREIDVALQYLVHE